MDSDIPKNKHLEMAVNHLNRVLQYAPMVADGREANVHLTPQDWQVVADALFQMNTPKEALPDSIQDYSLSGERTISLTTDDYDIELDVVSS